MAKKYYSDGMTNLGKAFAGVTLLAIVFLTFVGGYAAGYFKVFKGTLINDAMLAASSAYSQLTKFNDPIKRGSWKYATRQEQGLATYIPERTFAGATLYTSTHDSAAVLIDMEGNQLRRWHIPFSDVWPSPTHLQHAPKDEETKWRKAQVYPNGDLLAIYEAETVTPSGLGLVKVNKDSEVLWKYSDAVHHDVRIGADGSVYALTYDFRQEPVTGFPVLEPPMLVDSIAILDPDGNELNKIDVLEALLDSPYRRLLFGASPNKLGNYFHTNSIQPLTEEVAAAFDFAEPGQILISMRELSAVALIDPATKKAVWGMRGPWIGQHAAELLPNGRMLIYDNKGNVSGNYGNSRILEFDPHDYRVHWSYTGSPAKQFTSYIRGAQQRLGNGNTLITESDSGRLFEVTPDGEVVWEYINPVRFSEDDRYLPAVMWGTRYRFEELDFLP